MKKTFLAGLLLSILFGGCGKSIDANTTYPYFLNAYIQNIKYSTSSVATFRLQSQPGCIASKVYDITNIGQINVSGFYLDCYIKHYAKNSDFSPTKATAYKMYDAGLLLSATPCNGDLIVGLVDNSIPNLFNNTVLQSANIVNSITNIAKTADSSAAYYTYLIKGNFSCNFKNTNSLVIPVVGDYSVPIKVSR